MRHDPKAREVLTEWWIGSSDWSEALEDAGNATARSIEKALEARNLVVVERGTVPPWMEPIFHGSSTYRLTEDQ